MTEYGIVEFEVKTFDSKGIQLADQLSKGCYLDFR